MGGTFGGLESGRKGETEIFLSFSSLIAVASLWFQLLLECCRLRL